MAKQEPRRQVRAAPLRGVAQDSRLRARTGRDALQAALRAVALVDHLEHVLQLGFRVHARVVAQDVGERRRLGVLAVELEHAVLDLALVAADDVPGRATRSATTPRPLSRRSPSVQWLAVITTRLLINVPEQNSLPASPAK